MHPSDPLSPWSPQDYLSKCLAHVLNVLKHTSERGAAFSALADMATSLAAVHCAAGFETYLQGIHVHIREAISSRVKAKIPCPEALQVGAVGLLACMQQ